MIIETRNLTKYYGAARGVINLDLAVREGEVFGYLGPNGAGKTTTIRLLLDLIRPTSGSATIFGLDVRRDSVAIRARLGNLPGEFALYGNLTGWETLFYLGNLRGRVPENNIRALAQRFDLDLNRPVRALSHGNKQKLGLLQAFMHEPELLILDEPTTGLDPLIQQEFYNLIAETKAAGRTVFLSSHVLPEVERTCDRVGIIRDGLLASVEDVAQLKQKAMRKVEIRFAQPVPLVEFKGIAGVSDLSMDNHMLRCTVAGAMDALLKTASRFSVVEMTSREPSLEEVFLAYYTGPAAKPEAAHAA